MMRIALTLLVLSLIAAGASAQSSSLMRIPRTAPGNGQNPASPDAVRGSSPFASAPPRETAKATTRVLEASSFIAVPAVQPRKFKPEDQVTIIVRQQKKYEADARVESEKKWRIDGKLSEWFRFHPRSRLGSDNLTAGKPGFKFDHNNKYETDGSNEREDKFITRIQARIIDVKPNGNLVLEAKQEEKHDDETIIITVTGTCRSDDVTPENTILSTQIADLKLVEENKGAMRDATRKGWIPKVMDILRPF